MRRFYRGMQKYGFTRRDASKEILRALWEKMKSVATPSKEDAVAPSSDDVPAPSQAKAEVPKST